MLRDRYRLWGLNNKNSCKARCNTGIVVCRIRKGRSTSSDDTNLHSEDLVSARNETLSMAGGGRLSRRRIRRSACRHCHTAFGPRDEGSARKASTLNVNSRTDGSTYRTMMAFAPTSKPAPALTIPPNDRYLRRACHAMASWYEASLVELDSHSYGNAGLGKVLDECDSTFEVWRLGYSGIWTILQKIGIKIQACLSQQLHPLDLMNVAEYLICWTDGRDYDLVEPVVTLMRRLAGNQYGTEHPLPLLCGLLNDRTSLAQLCDANFALAESQYFPRMPVGVDTRVAMSDHYARVLIRQDRYTEALECIPSGNVGHRGLLTTAHCKRRQGLLAEAASALGAAWDDVVDRGQELSADALEVLDAHALFCYRTEDLNTAAHSWRERLKILLSMEDRDEMDVLYTVRRLEQMYRKGSKLQELECLRHSYPSAFEQSSYDTQD